MYVRDISLTDFRNYSQLRVSPHPQLNFITGPNASGKTNFLEALYFSGLGRSFRGQDRDVIKWGTNGAAVKTVYALQHLTVEVEAEITADGKKKLLVNGAENGRRELPGRFGIVLFKPDDLQIIKGPPAQRRDFIDGGLGYIFPLYRDALRKYRRVLAQRNNLLRSGGDRGGESFRVWDEQFYFYGAQVLHLRIRLLKKFFPLVSKVYNEVSGASEKLAMRYLSTVKLTDQSSMEQILKDITTEGKAREREELYKGQTLIGPHRDDLVFYLDGRDIRQFGSQGQVRTLALALKAAQLDLFYLETGEQPLLLLDDVLMELDESRQQYLMQMIDGRLQCFITSATGREKFGRYQGKIYLVDGSGMKEV